MSAPTGTADAALIAGTVGRELRRLRLRAGLTLDDVALRTGSHRPIVCRAERGVHAPSLETCARFARACGGDLGHVLLAVDLALGLLPPTACARPANDNGRT